MKTLYLILTSRCNLKCEFCFYIQDPWRLAKDKIDFNFFCSVIHQASGFGFEEISFTGGEPLLSGDIFKLIKFAKSLKLETTISTNAALLDIKTTQNLKKAGLDNIYISLASEYFFDKKRKNEEGWEVRAVKILGLTKKAGIKKATLVFVVTKENFKFLRNVIDFAERKNVFLQIQPAYIYSKKSKLSLFGLNRADWKQFERLLKIWAKKQDKSEQYLQLILSYYSPAKRKQSPSCCHFAKEDVVVDADGSVYPCFHRQDLLLGNILKDSLGSCIKRLKYKNKQEMLRAECFGEHCLSLFTD